MKRIYLLLIVTMLTMAAKAQTAASYVFARTTGTYTSIVGASGTTSTTTISGDDNTLTSINIGFSFVYCGTTYTTLSACSNGWISLSNSTATVYYNDGGLSGAANSGVGLLMPYWDDLNGSGSTAYYQTTGTAPNRVFTFQWGDPAGSLWGNYYSAGTYATWQVKLYESSNVIQYIYGTGGYVSTATIGISNSTSDLLDLTNQSSTTATTTFSYGVSGSPAANSVMTWTPPPTMASSPSSMTFTVGAGLTSSVQTVNISGYGFTSSPITLNAPTYFQIYNTGTATWVSSMTVTTSSVSPTVGTYIPSTGIQVRFNAPLTTGAYTGNLAMTGGGLASAVNVALTGNSTNACSGTPTAGTAAVSPTAGGSTTPFTLTGTGYTVASNITFQWQSSTTGTGGWTNITGATNDIYSFTGITANTFYRLNVTCTNSSITSTTGVIQATFLPPATCNGAFYYSTSANSYALNNLTITGYSGSTLNDNGPSSHPGSGYEDRTAAVAPVNLMQAGSYSGSVTYAPTYWYYENQIWIDFNNSGSFESSEIVTPVFGTPAVSTASSTFTLTIPAGAATGAHRMRIRTPNMSGYTSLSAIIDPCTYYDAGTPYNYYYYGTTRDYIANIVPQPACSGTPTAGTVSPSATLGCGTLVSTLSTTGATSGVAGLTYQWQSSPDNTTWTNVTGATNSTASITTGTTLYYRSQITCTNSSITSSSSGVQLTVNPLPAAITGNTLVCASGTTTLASATSGGVWSSSNTTVANINSSTGVATIGSSAGYAVISYTLSSTGCRQITAINVNTVTPTAAATATPNVICSGGSSTLSASSTTTLPTYDVLAIPYSLVTQTSPTTLSFPSTDDSYTAVSLPFSFSFFGTSYTTINVVTNGYLQFTVPGTSYGGYTLPSASMPNPAISLIHRDLNIAGAPGGAVTYSTEGVSPNRRFVIYYYNVCDYGSSAGGNTGQVILYEGTNQIDVLITSTTNNTHVSAAIQNSGGSLAYVAPNRNWGTYQVSTPEAWSFKPPQPLQYTWSPSATLSSSTGATVTASNVTTTPTAVYTVGVNFDGCIGNATATLTVNPLPAAITGAPQVCEGLTTLLATTSTGGTWTSSTGSVATVGSATGVVTGVLAGTSTVSYTFTSTGCRATQVVTVNPLPATITGTASACVGATTTLADATAGGTWSSGTTAVASIGSTTGIVNGVSAGLATVTYTLPTSCIRTVQATINPLPVTTITPSSSVTICAGDAAALTANAPLPQFSILNQDFNSSLTGWTINSPSGVPASAWHTTTSPASGVTGDGTLMLESNAQFPTPTETILTSPGFSTMGYGTATLTFNQYLISIATSDANVDVDYSINNGTTWTTILNQVGVSSTATTWTAATPNVSVALPAGALGQSNVKLRWHYFSNYGLYWDIDNIKVLAYQPAATYSWSGVGGATGLACTACGANTITPTATGSNVYSVVTTTSAGCQSTVGATVSVNPLPAAVTGGSAVCVNSSITLANATGGGTWSSGSATVSVALSTGVVTGVSAGTAIVTYTLPTGCRSTKSITINALPANSTGAAQVCEGLTTALSNATSGGTWSSSMSSVASVSASGVVTGNAAGIADIYYTLTATGCRVATNMTVNPTPAAITGGLQVCEGLTSALSDPNTGGTWASSTPAVATINTTTGVASGLVAGMSTITYTLPTTCLITANLTVNPLPAAITGTMQVCEGLTTPLADATSGGAWSSSSTNASVNASGVVTGMAFGVEVITYQLPTTCLRTASVTVNPVPAVITGSTQVCAGLSTALANSTTGGTWASGSTGIATIDATTGMVTGVTAGTSTITYQLGTGCIRTTDMTVNPLPAALTGIRQVCEGLTTTLASASAGGTWASSAFGVADVDASGIVSAFSAGVTTITYQLPTSCIITADVTVNPLPASITGAAQVCEASSTALSNATAGGTWATSDAAIATVNAAGIVFGTAAGNATITYQLPTGCISTANMLVNPLPATILGATQVCVGLSTNLSDATGSGTWSSSASTVAAVDVSGVVTGMASGPATITYMLPTGCIRTLGMVVNPQPAAITGAMQVCQSATTVLGNSSVGGVWTSGATGIASVGAGTGVVTGVSAGTAGVTYTLPTTCRVSATVTVNPTPAAITGVQQVCAGSTTVLSDGDAGGVWTTSLPSLASVTPATGVVTGVSMGNAVITYTLPTTCKTMAVVTVNPLPAPIAGAGQACEGAASLFTNGSSGGVWTSSTSAVATIDNTTGSIAAIAPGTTIMTYTLPTTCLRTRVFTVNQLPAAITGTTQVCESGTTVLNNATGGGVWSSSSVTTANINSSGTVSGIAAGLATITYMLPTGCKATTPLVVNQLPAVIDGSATACTGQTTTLSNTVVGGTWSTASAAIATADMTTGVITGVSAGITSATYALPTGCLATRNVVINPTPAAISGAPQVCQGATTVMSNTTSGGVWTSSAPGIASINLSSGVLSGLTAGTVAVSYTMLTGCSVTASMIVNPLPSPVSGSLSVCYGQATTLSTVTTGGSWVSSNPAVATVTTSGVVTGTDVGNATIGYMLSTGCARNSAVTVNALPAVYNVTGGGNYCAGGSGVHVGLDGSVTGISYHMYAGSTPITIATGTTGLPVDFGLITPAGTYNVIARNTSTGCTSNMTGVATVGVSPVVAPDVTISSPDAVCDGSLTDFTSIPTNGGTAPTYTWRVNGVIQPGVTGAIFSYTPANGDVIASSVTSSNACAVPATATSSKTMTVNANVMPVANVTSSSGFAVCQGNAVTFTAATLYGGSAPVYTWYKNSSVAGSGSTFTYTPVNGDHISVKLGSNYNCRLADEVTSATVTMTTMPIYVPAITISADPGTHIQPGTNVTLTANVVSGGPAPVYQWYINTTAIPSATNATFTYSLYSEGDSVSCQVSGTGLCGMSAFNSVIIHLGASGISATGAGIADLRLVPNPNKGLFTVKGTLATATDEEVMLEVTNMLGQVVYRQGVTAKNGVVNEQVQLSNTLANGMYMLNLKTGADSKVFHFVLEQ